MTRLIMIDDIVTKHAQPGAIPTDLKHGSSLVRTRGTEFYWISQRTGLIGKKYLTIVAKIEVFIKQFVLFFIYTAP